MEQARRSQARSGLTDAERLLVVAAAARTAELWAAGKVDTAERWADALWRTVDGREYVETDDAIR